MWPTTHNPWLYLVCTTSYSFLMFHRHVVTYTCYFKTSSSAVAKRPRDISCLSVISFNSTKRRVESFIVSYVVYRLITACSKMRCSVVFGVTLRLLVINISSSSPAINAATYCHRCVITCDTLAMFHRRPRLQHLPVAALTQAVKPDISSESRFPPTAPAFDAPVRGVSVGILLCRLTPKNQNDVFISFDTILERDRHTDRQTDRHKDTAWRHRPRLCIASRGNEVLLKSTSVNVRDTQ